MVSFSGECRGAAVAQSRLLSYVSLGGMKSAGTLFPSPPSTSRQPRLVAATASHRQPHFSESRANKLGSCIPTIDHTIPLAEPRGPDRTAYASQRCPRGVSRLPKKTRRNHSSFRHDRALVIAFEGYKSLCTACMHAMALGVASTFAGRFTYGIRGLSIPT
jgi:hypothetical protein